MSPDNQSYLELGYWIGFLASVTTYFVGIGVHRLLDAWHASYLKRKEK